MVLLIIILSIPSVQTKIAKKVTDNLNETYGTDIQIRRIGLNWKGEVDIRDVFIKDHHQDTLIYAQYLQTNILSIKKLIDGKLDFGFVDLTNAKLRVKTYQGEQEDNLNIFTQKFDSGDTTTVEPFQLLSRNISLENAELRVSDENLETPVSVDLKNLNLDASDFSIYGPVIESKIASLSFLEHRGIEVKNLKADFKYTETELVLNNLELETPYSVINGSVVMTFEEGMSDFNNKVFLDVVFDDSHIATNDLNKVYPEFGKNMVIGVDGNFKGSLNDFTFTDAVLSFGDTQITGDFMGRNLLNEDIFSITARNHSIATNYFDLRKFMPNVIGKDLPAELKSFGNFTLVGDSNLTGDVLKTKSQMFSTLGYANIVLEMGNIKDFANAYYHGSLELDKFDMGTMAGTTSLGTITANINFDGRGFTAASLSTLMKGTISSFQFEGYDYKNIEVAGNLKNPLFNGKLTIDDPNLQMEFDGLVDVSKKQNHYDFEANIEFAELNKLNLFTRDSVSVFAGKIKMDMDGTTVNDVAGTINFTETFYQTSEKDFFFDDFSITSSFLNDERTIEINSPDIINGRIRGKFLLEDIPYLFRNSIGSIYTNYIPIQVTNDQYVNYEFEIYNKIVDVFVPQLQLGDNTRIKGAVYSDESKFQLDFRSPEMLVYENYFGKVNVQLDNDNPLYNAYISIDSLYNGKYNLVDVNIINKTLKDTLYIQSEFKGGKDQNDLFNLSLYHTINPEGNSVVGIKKSKINYKGNDWFLNRENNNLNKITFDDNFRDIKLDSLTLRHENELIQMAGFKRDSSLMDVKIEFSNVDIGKIVPQVDSLDLRGKLNGNLNLTKKKGSFYPRASLVVEDISINNVAFGNLDLKIKGSENLTFYTIESSLLNKNVASFKADGTLDVTGEEAQIDLSLAFQDFNLKAFSPFGGEVVTNIRGFVTGDAKVKGNYKAPDMNGNLFLNETGLTIPYLNTDFNLADNSRIFIAKDKLTLNRTTITDTQYDTKGTLAGSVTHKNFSKWGLDLYLETDRMLVLDTPPDEDALYYGTAFISGNATIQGPVDELVIDVTATTEEGTTFKIPISDAASIGDDSFIRFISPEEKKARINGETYVAEEVKGLTLNFDLDINDNAEMEILVDPVNNSKFRGRGAGLMFLEINTLGKFKMWGEFIIIEGKYDFRYGGLVDKTIDMVPGGRITWDGEPTKAQLDLTATYLVPNVNPSALLDTPSLSNTVDVKVLLNLTGQIMQPDLDFQLDFPGVSSTLQQDLTVRLADKEQRQLQSIYLLATGSFQGDGGSNIAGTLTERVNKLVADILSDDESKFKVVPTIGTRQVSLDQQLEYQIGVELSTKISERILVNGRIAVPVGGANESTVAGDLEVQWLVNDDGSLRINFFNRQADLQFIGEDQIYEQGGGVSYSVDFDTFKELMWKLFKKKVSKESDALPVDQRDSDIDPNIDAQGTKQDEIKVPAP